MTAPKSIYELCQTHCQGIVVDLHHLDMVTEMVIRRLWGGAPGIAHARAHHAIY